MDGDGIDELIFTLDGELIAMRGDLKTKLWSVPAPVEEQFELAIRRGKPIILANSKICSIFRDGATGREIFRASEPAKSVLDWGEQEDDAPAFSPRRAVAPSACCRRRSSSTAHSRRPSWCRERFPNPRDPVFARAFPWTIRGGLPVNAHDGLVAGLVSLIVLGPWLLCFRNIFKHKKFSLKMMIFLVALAAFTLIEFRLFYKYVMFEYNPKPREAIFFLKVVGLGLPVFAAFLSLGSCLAPRRIRRFPWMAIVFVALGAIVGAIWLMIDAPRWFSANTTTLKTKAGPSCRSRCMPSACGKSYASRSWGRPCDSFEAAVIEQFLDFEQSSFGFFRFCA